MSGHRTKWEGGGLPHFHKYENQGSGGSIIGKLFGLLVLEVQVSLVIRSRCVLSFSTANLGCADKNPLANCHF